MKTDFMMPSFCNLTEFKICISCGETKPSADFRMCRTGRNAGLQLVRCSPCQKTYERQYRANNKEQYNATLRAWREKHPENRKSAELTFRLKKYGLSNAQFEALNKAQNGRCAICKTDKGGKREQQLCIDHCHTTGKVRGLLCDWCNKLLGDSKDSIETLSNAIEYLERSSNV